MEHSITIREILTSIGTGRDEVQVWASATSDYNQETQKVSVRIERGAREAMSGEGAEAPGWLPHGETITEHLPREDVLAFTKDVFQRWIKKAHAATPLDVHINGTSIQGVPHE